MKHSSICICSMLGGAIIGSALTLFLAPHSGPELRKAVREYFEKEAEKMRCHCGENNFDKD